MSKKIIKEMDDHLRTLEMIALARDVKRVDEYIRSNDFRVHIFAIDNHDSPMAYINLIKTYSDGDYFCISTLDNTIYAVSSNVVVCRRGISSNLAMGLDTTACWVVAYRPSSSKEEKRIARRILNIES